MRNLGRAEIHRGAKNLILQKFQALNHPVRIAITGKYRIVDRFDDAALRNQRDSFEQRHSRHLECRKFECLLELIVDITNNGKRQVQTLGHFLLIGGILDT